IMRFSRELGKEVDRITPEALELLQRYPWPGNVRELQSVLKQAILQATGPVLNPSCFPPVVLAGAGTCASSRPRSSAPCCGPTARSGCWTAPPECPEAPGAPAAPVSPPGGYFEAEALLRRRLSLDARDLYAEAHRELDRHLIPRVVEYTGGN